VERNGKRERNISCLYAGNGRRDSYCYALTKGSVFPFSDNSDHSRSFRTPVNRCLDRTEVFIASGFLMCPVLNKSY
jgi:hypothetical protein